MAAYNLSHYHESLQRESLQRNPVRSRNPISLSHSEVSLVQEGGQLQLPI